MEYKETYSPGPTAIRHNVSLARTLEVTNPDIDRDFVEYYHRVASKFGELIGTCNPVYLLSGEGILGLECAVASLTEPGDRVLVLDNGIFGQGFGDFVSLYGGEPVVYSGDYRKPLNPEKLEAFLEKDHHFAYATLVHCDTPTGVMNPVDVLCPLLKKYGILTVVDSVAGMVGEPLHTDKSQIDIILGGTQKALSAPVGLTMVGVSKDARQAMEERATPIPGFYCNLRIWEDYHQKKAFPYTLPASDILAFERAVDNVLEEGIAKVVERHEKIARGVRGALQNYGLKLYLEEGYSNNVTALEVPEGMGALTLQRHMAHTYELLLATSLGDFENTLIRIGHMGENARVSTVLHVLNILDLGLKDLGFVGQGRLPELFAGYLGE